MPESDETYPFQCPICRKPVRLPPEGAKSDFPFCSDRCKLVDLGRWMNGTYRIPVSPPDSSEEHGSPNDDQ